MTRINVLKSCVLGAAFAAAALSPLFSATTAEARGKQYFSQTYDFDRPMHGYSGRAGSYYCDYQRLPNRVCSITANGQERCEIKGWTLRQHCY